MEETSELGIEQQQLSPYHQLEDEFKAARSQIENMTKVHHKELAQINNLTQFHNAMGNHQIRIINTTILKKNK